MSKESDELKEEEAEDEERSERSTRNEKKKSSPTQRDLGNFFKKGGTAGSAMMGGAAAGGMALGSKTVSTFGDYGMIVAILGLFTFFADLTGSPTLFVILETVLLFISVIYIFRWRGILPITLFWIWYFLLGGVATTDPQGMLSLLLVFFVIGAFLRGVISKFVVKEGFLYGGGMEIEGAVPLIFLFLDMGAAEYVVKILNSITFLNLSLNIQGTTLETILIFTPWWTLLGIMSIKKENFFVSLLKIGCVIYIMSLLLAGIAPEAYHSYNSQLPGPTELLQAKKEFREQAATQANPFVAFLRQISCSMSDPTNSKECIQKKEEEAAVKKVCEEEKGLLPGSTLYKDCEQQELLKKKNPSFQVFGTVDPTIKQPTTAKIVLDVKSFPSSIDQKLPFPAEIEIKNPRRQNLQLEATCSFDGKDGAKDVEGEIPQRRTSENQPFVISDAYFKDTFLCSPAETLEGRYILQFNLTLKNLSTTSRLQRAFIGDKSAAKKERLYKEEISRVIKQSESLAPADLAWLSFDIGNAAKEVMIENKPYRTLVVRSKIENKGKGEIVNVQKYEIGGLEDLGFTGSAEQEFRGLADLGFITDETPVGEAGLGCTENQQNFIPRAVEQREDFIPLPVCTIISYPEKFKNPEDWIPMQFLGNLIYDYRITTKVEVKIEKTTE